MRAAPPTYKRVTDLALKHVKALTALSAAEPARFQTLGVVGLIYQPGTWTDQKLSVAVASLVEGERAAEAAQSRNE